MMQLDLFGAPALLPTTEENTVLKKRTEAAIEKVTNEEEMIELYNNQDSPGTESDQHPNNPAIKMYPDELPSDNNPALPEEIKRTGRVVFEDNKISVKLKTKSSLSQNKNSGDAPGQDAQGPNGEKMPVKIQPKPSVVTKQQVTEYSIALNAKLFSVKNSIKEGLLLDPAEKKKKERQNNIPQKRGRKSLKEINDEADLVNVPDDEALFTKQYYSISEVAGWFNVNTSLLRFWENEFDILKPRKNRKGDRMFRPEDVKNLQLIYQLLRERKYSIEGAKEFLKTNKSKAETQLQLTTTLQKFKSFLLDLKANLQ